jgi:hypothetical protein
MTDTARPSYLESLRDLFATGARLYPLALTTGVSYWSELAAGASTYYVDTLERLFVALGHPQQGPKILADLTTRFKDYLVRSGDATEHAILDFNQRLEAHLRQPRTTTPTTERAGDEPLAGMFRALADAAMKETWKPRPEVQAFRQELERLLEETRRLERSTPAAESAASS